MQRLPSELLKQARLILHGLAAEPRPRGVKKLTGYELYRVRVRDWRIVYEISDTELLVPVVKIANRGDVGDEL